MELSDLAALQGKRKGFLVLWHAARHNHHQPDYIIEWRDKRCTAVIGG